MPINATVDYYLAEEKFKNATSDQEKLDALKEMLSKSPSHKGAENLRNQIKAKISKLKKQLEKERVKRGGKKGIHIKKEGAARVILIGLPNAGKSHILSKISKAKPEIAEYEFTTREPEVGMMNYEGINIQTIELPAFFKGFYENANGPLYMSFIRDADALVIILDGKKNPEEDLKLILNELRKGNVKIDDEGVFGIPCLVIVNKEYKYLNSIYKTCSLEKAKEEIWKKLNLIYVYTKTPGKKHDYPPVSLYNGSVVSDLAEIVHKDFLKKFKYARIWGPSVKHDGITAGLDHVLKSKDVVEFHMK